MRDYLMDIVKNTYGLGFINLVKVVGTESETRLEAISEDKTVILKAKINNPVPEFIGTFGMPNLSKLNIILGIPEYKENAKLSITTKDRDGVVDPDNLHFENAAGDFKNDYRFMSSSLVTGVLKKVNFLGANWHVDVEPTAAAIQRLKFMASANSEETTFVAKTENGDLKFFFGDHSTHAGNFVFHSGVSGNITKGWKWPVASVVAILTLSGNKQFKLSDDGAMQITVDTGLASYDYIIPALSK